MARTIKEVKSMYYRDYYRKHKSAVKKSKNIYWYRKACKILGKEEVTDEEVQQVYNDYYRAYRKANKEAIQKNNDDFWKKLSKENSNEKQNKTGV